MTASGTGSNDGCDGRQASAEPDEGGLSLKGAALPLVGGRSVVRSTDYGSYLGSSADECEYTWEELISLPTLLLHITLCIYSLICI